MRNKVILSPLCTQSTIKANTGRNRMVEMATGKGFLFPQNWTVNDKINYKTLSAIPSKLYREYELMNTLKNKQ